MDSADGNVAMAQGICPNPFAPVVLACDFIPTIGDDTCPCLGASLTYPTATWGQDSDRFSACQEMATRFRNPDLGAPMEEGVLNEADMHSDLRITVSVESTAR